MALRPGESAGGRNGRINFCGGACCIVVEMLSLMMNASLSHADGGLGSWLPTFLVWPGSNRSVELSGVSVLCVRVTVVDNMDALRQFHSDQPVSPYLISYLLVACCSQSIQSKSPTVSAIVISQKFTAEHNLLGQHF